MVGGRAPDQTMFDRVVRFGPCSAVVVSEQALVTSAHCLAFSVKEVSTNGEIIPIASSTAHPALVSNDPGFPRRAPALPAGPDQDAAVASAASLAIVATTNTNGGNARGRGVREHSTMSAGRFCLEEGISHGNEERARRSDG